MREISRSTHEKFDECLRQGYLATIYRGGGLEERKRPWNLIIGLAVHKGQEALMLNARDGSNLDVWDWVKREFNLQAKGWEDDIFTYAQNLALSQALVLGFEIVYLPILLKAYDIILVEEETRTLLAPNLRMKHRADVVVRAKSDGRLFVINWKTSNSLKDWLTVWEDDIQAMTEALGTEEHLKEKIAGVIYVGLYKASTYKGVSTSPLITGYRSAQPGGGYKYKANRAEGYDKFSPWQDGEFPGGLEGWLHALDEEIVGNQYAFTQPILKQDDLVRDWLRQTVRFHTDIDAMLQDDVPEEDRLLFFRQEKGKRCRWCAFRPACRGEASIEGLVEDGRLVPRQDHHEQKKGES